MEFLPRKESVAKRRGKAFRATEASVSGHKSAMDAIKAASLNSGARLLGQNPHPSVVAAMGSSYRQESMDPMYLHLIDQAGPEVLGSPEQKVSRQRRMGFITDQEAIKEKAYISQTKNQGE
jgi:hypothetical protein